ncbi:hypothetical protein XELAEV_18022348mg [Xenopus laevis]|uniref:Uncharacterized protein n=1 Tax=Xenopus laevis TaxID=8355 RepID=A0A974D4L8_XENLA|nr:hypothetical protein XELAEV_18022348mg [Xenopus laevis]
MGLNGTSQETWIWGKGRALLPQTGWQMKTLYNSPELLSTSISPKYKNHLIKLPRHQIILCSILFLLTIIFSLTKNIMGAKFAPSFANFYLGWL